jgi:hypothetical protein
MLQQIAKTQSEKNDDAERFRVCEPVPLHGGGERILDERPSRRSYR